MDAKGDAPAALAAKQPAKKGMRMRVAELDADGNVVMVDKLIGEGTQGSLDDYRSKDNRVNPDGAGEAVAPTTVLAAASAGDLDTLRALLKDGGDSNQVEFYTTVFRNLDTTRARITHRGTCSSPPSLHPLPFNAASALA
jgi:hypothetical protein